MSNSKISSSSSRILCDYSSSSEEEEDQNNRNQNNEPYNEMSRDVLPSAKRFRGEKDSPKILPPVPSSIHTMYLEPEHRLNGPPASSRNPALHDHRIRSFPHARGNWATSVYIKVRDKRFSD